MKLIPTLDRIAIKREEKAEKSKGGIILPGKAQKETNYGTVVAVGPGAFNMDGSRRPVSIKKGDFVFFTDDFYTTVEKTDIVIVDEESVLAIVKD